MDKNRTARRSLWWACLAGGMLFAVAVFAYEVPPHHTTGEAAACQPPC